MFGLIQTVQFLAFAVDYRFRRIDILCHGLVAAQGAPAEGHDFARYAVDGIDDTPLETVIDVASVIAYAKSGFDKIFFIVAFGDGCFEERVSLLDRVTEVKTADHGVVDASFPEVGKSDLTPVGCVCQVVLEVLQGESVHRKH